ncbi:MAG: hypothetical protein R2853_09370 [Thermomicrobiales bacterium]|nr:hypothetical protein [Thermomicrobiales bacterium]
MTAQTSETPPPGTTPGAEETGAAPAASAALVTIDEHLPGAFTFRIKVTESGTLFLVLPRRDPAQPRFWCVVVVRCAPGGIVDPTERGWLGKQGLRREELGSTMTEIRENVNEWLTEPAQKRLLAWVRTAPPTPAINDTAASHRRKPS